MNFQGHDFEARDFDPNDHWGTPDLAYLGTGRREAPTFPTSILGSWEGWTTNAAQGASAPVDYTGVSLLACAAAAIANVRWGATSSGWSEPPALWIGQVGGPGAGKSPGTEPTFDLLRHVEDFHARDHENDVRVYTTAKTVAKLSREEWESEVRSARKSGHPPPDQPAEAVEPKAPVRPRIRVADATIEALGVLAANLPRGLLLVRDELAGWLGSFDKYGGGGADRAFALEMFGGRSYVVDRVKSPEPLLIRHLTVGVLGGIQPDRLAGLLSGPDDGLVPRVLWAWPERIPEFRLSRSNRDDRAAQAALLRLATLPMGSDPYGTPEPRRVRLTPDAEAVLEEFAREVGIRAQGASGLFAGSLIKARGHVLRLATTLEYLWWCRDGQAAEPDAISVTAVENAAGLVDGYFIPMAERVFGDAAIPKAERSARFLARYLHKRQQPKFNARQVGREVGGPLRETADMDAACATLMEASIVRPSSIKGTGRRPKLFDVHPQLWRPQ